MAASAPSGGLSIERKWQPHLAQQHIMNARPYARYRIVACGRRFGKSEMAAHEMVEAALAAPGGKIWWVAPTYDAANDYGWDTVYPAIPKALIERKNRSKPRSIKLINDAELSFRSADREDSLRGAGLDFLIVDEAGSIPDHRWTEELRPTLMDERAPMLAIGTPKGKNWFYRLFQRGQDPQYPTYASWQASTYSNPHIHNDEIEEARLEMSDREYSQEILAQFIDDSGSVFSNVRECVADWTFDDPPKWEPPFNIGVDLARVQNFSVVVVMDRLGRVCHFERLRGASWTPIMHAIVSAGVRFRPHKCFVDATRDNKLIQDLEQEGMFIERITFTGGPTGTKREMIENLAVRLEQQDIEYPDIPELINELEIYDYETLPSGNVRYGAPEGAHDDVVDAMALAARKPFMAKATW